MDITVSSKNISGRISAIPSKSDAHRALIAAALADKPTEISLESVSLDIDATIGCLKALGADITLESTQCKIVPIRTKAESPVLDCNESGSTLRFLIPVAAARSYNPHFTGQGRLSERPLLPLISAMEKCGCSFSSTKLPLTIGGKLEAGQFNLPGDISSQFISGLLFALPALSHKSRIVLTSPLQSSAYVDMTIDTLKKFGVEITRTENGFSSEGNQTYKSPGTYYIEGDWSNAAFLLTAAALGGEITVDNLSLSSKQSDKYIIDILEKFGADISFGDDFVTVKNGSANPFDIDIAQCPDLFPITAILACGANGKSTLYNAKRLRLKESDRIDSTLSLITALGGRAEANDDSLTVYGSGRLAGGSTSSFNDHRIAMAAAVASVICENPVTVSDFQAINKSYPDFATHFKKSGGQIYVI